MTFRKFIIGMIICIILSICIRIGLNSIVERPIGKVEIVEEEIEIELELVK